MRTGGGGVRRGFFTEKILSLSVLMDDVFKQIFSKWRKETKLSDVHHHLFVNV